MYLCFVGIYPSTGKIYNQITFSQSDSLATQYTLEVRASDNGDVPKTATCTVRISIIDENDHAPQFEKPVFELTVSEAVYPGAEVSSCFHTRMIVAINLDAIFVAFSGRQTLNHCCKFGISSIIKFNNSEWWPLKL